MSADGTSRPDGWPIVHNSKWLAALWALVAIVVVSTVMVALAGVL